MGKTFGNLYYIRNIVYFKVSSYEQKAFKGFWGDTMRNAWKEITTHAPYFAPPAAIAYLGFKWGVKERDRMVRKDPKLHEM